MSYDIDVFRFVNGFAGIWLLDELAMYEETCNLLKGGLFMTVIWVFWLRPGADRDARRSRIVTLLAGVILALLVNRAIAAAVPFRVRPMYVEGIGYHPLSLAFHPDLEHWNAFPSDTATYFFALSTAIALLSRKLGLALGVYTAGYICLSRLYVGIHYPSDLIAGAVLGIIVILAVNNRVLMAQLGDRVVALERRFPEWFYPTMFVVTYEMAVLFADVRVPVRGVRLVAQHYGVGPTLLLLLLAVVIACGAIYAVYRSGRRPLPTDHVPPAAKSTG
jgi:undecaprenyl-diphosphatase